MAAGSIIIDLLMRTGAFQTDTKRAEKTLRNFQKEAERIGKVIGLSIAGGLTGAVVGFDALIRSAGDFQDFADTVGDTGENIASLAVAAATAGVGMDAVTGSMNKLTKALTMVDDESKAVGSALKKIGINVEEFKKLDPVAQYEAIGKALAGFADGAGKTSIAMTLFGKAGAEQLKVFNALEDQGGRTVILTQQQIELADKYADTTTKLTAELKLYAQVIAVEVLGWLSKLIEETKTAEGSLGRFAAFLKGSGFGAGLSLVGIDIFGKDKETQLANLNLGLVTTNKLLEGGNLSEERRVRLLEKRRLIEAEISALASTTRADDPKDETQRLLGMSRARLKPLEDDGGKADKEAAEAAKKAAKEAEQARKKREADAASYLEGLAKEKRATEDLTRVEEVLADIAAGRFKEYEKGQAFKALADANDIDQAKQLVAAYTEAAKKEVEWADEREKASDRLRDAGKSVFDATRKPAEQYAIELERLNMLMEAGAINAETYGRAVINLQDQFDENVIAMKAMAQEINASVEGNFANAFAGFIDGSLSAKDAFSQFAKSVIADMSRMASQQLAKSLFGGDAQGNGGIGSWITGLAGLFGGGGGYSATGGGGYATAAGISGGRAEGGPVSAGSSYMVGERGPERFVPSTAGRIVPNEALAGRGDIQVVTPPGMPLTVQKIEERQSDGRMLEKLILSTVARDARQGGPAIQATAGVLGARRSLPRRGR